MAWNEASGYLTAMHVSRILETTLYAEDLIAAESFYTRVLGMEVYKRVPGRHVFFRCGKGMFLVFNPLATEQEESPHGCRGSGHVAWSVAEEDQESWRRWFRDAGVTIESEVEWPEGGHSLYFRDPAGNSLELATPRVWGFAEKE